jgi:hypothetical protein
MLRKKTDQSFSSVRARQPKAALSETFRRNNVVISRSQREMAAHQQSVTQRQQDRKKQLARQQIRGRFILICAVLLVVILGYRMRLNTAMLSTNASSRLTAELSGQYQASILKAYDTHTISGQSWLLDEAGFKDALMKQYPEIERLEVSSSAPLSTALKVDLRFRKAVFTWKDASNTQQFVDNSGVLFSKNLDPAVNIAKLIQIEDQSGVVLDTGTSVLSKQLIQFIGQLHAQLPPIYGREVSVARVIIPRSTREVHVQHSSQPYLIKLNSTRPLEEQVGELNSLLGYLRSKSIIPSTYIDLRTRHKAFYK